MSVRCPVNRGKGAAVREGMLLARGAVVAFTDADLSYSPDQIVRLLHRVEDGWDVVIGSRDHLAHIPLGNRAFAKALTAAGIPHVFEEEDGDHGSLLRVWMEGKVFPFFSGSSFSH